jgi:hypothetical protein
MDLNHHNFFEKVIPKFFFIPHAFIKFIFSNINAFVNYFFIPQAILNFSFDILLA